MLHSEKISLDIGLDKPVKILHLTDVHISLADDEDGDSMKRHAEGRRKVFTDESCSYPVSPEDLLREAMEYGRGFDATVITGDVMDFVSHAVRVETGRILEPYDYLFCAGNHEFCPRVGTKDSFDYREQISDLVQAEFHGNMIFDSRVCGGVNLISMDNSFYVWTEEQFEKLRSEIDKGYPCLLFCHVPLLDPFLNHDPSHENLKVDDETAKRTRDITKFIIDSPAIKAVFAGHYHNTALQELPGGKPCYILGGLFKGIVGEITVN